MLLIGHRVQSVQQVAMVLAIAMIAVVNSTIDIHRNGHWAIDDDVLSHQAKRHEKEQEWLHDAEPKKC